MDVLDRLIRVEQDIERAISAKGWCLNEPGRVPRISPREGKKRTRELNQAEAVVTATEEYIDKTRECLMPPDTRWRRFREWLTGELLMSVYTNLHAAETNRVLLLSSDQLAAFLPTIRERAAAYLSATDARVVALNGLPDPTAPAHQALARVQTALINNVTQAHAQTVPAPPASGTARQNGATAGTQTSNGQRAGQPATVVQAPASQQTGGPAAGSAIVTQGDEPAAADKDALRPEAGTADPGAGNPPADQNPGQATPSDQAESKSEVGGRQGGGSSGDGQDGTPLPAAASLSGAYPKASAVAQDASIVKLTEMLGRDQQVAATAMYEACRAEDLQQSQVRRFRDVLIGTFVGLFVLVIVLALLGGAHPSYFPLCLQSPQRQGTQAVSVICPTGSHTASSADLPLVLLLGGVGATLAVALNLAGLKPAGVRYSLSVAQGLLKIAFGAMTAMLGIVILSTQTTASGILSSQAGLLATAVVFGYSQQLFTRLIDRQANDLMNAASSTTKASPAAASL
ncbi:MAG TPA: hypothetical protein VF070_25940 [Streptosporangiaceae bacterium]